MKKMTAEKLAKWRDKLQVTWLEVGQGVWQYMALHPEYAAPVGVVWSCGYGGETPTTNIIHAYTLPWFRRRGVLSAIVAQMLKHFKFITTATGTNGKEGGMAYLKAAGWTHDKKRGDWYLTAPKVPAPKK